MRRRSLFVLKDTRRVGDAGRSNEKVVTGEGGGSEIFSRFDGYAVWHDSLREREREKTIQRQLINTLLFVFIPHKRDLYTRPMRVLSRHDRHQTLAHGKSAKKGDFYRRGISTARGEKIFLFSSIENNKIHTAVCLQIEIHRTCNI
jgi:hypothetical protein